jgi:hypothetical protein
MLRPLAARRISCLLPVLLLLGLPLAAQTPSPEPAAVPVSNEPHHHLVLENSYIRAYYVNVAPHESTLQHRHDLPYFGVLVSGGGSPAAPAVGAATPQSSQAPRAIYSPGGVSHTVRNPADVPFRNVTVELLRPQGRVRNRCTEIVQGQPLEQCDLPPAGEVRNPSHYAVFETDEILVEYWTIEANSTAQPLDGGRDVLLVDLDGPSVTAAGGIDSRNAAPGGVLWLPAGSKPVFKSPPDRGGRFFAISFKDKPTSSSSQK